MSKKKELTVKEEKYLECLKSLYKDLGYGKVSKRMGLHSYVREHGGVATIATAIVSLGIVKRKEVSTPPTYRWVSREPDVAMIRSVMSWSSAYIKASGEKHKAWVKKKPKRHQEADDVQVLRQEESVKTLPKNVVSVKDVSEGARNRCLNFDFSVLWGLLKVRVG